MDSVEWLSVAGGLTNTCAVDTITGVYCVGQASTGANGNGDLTNNVYGMNFMALALVSPYLIKSRGNTMYISSMNGTAFVWGDNSSGQTGLLVEETVVPRATLLEITGIVAITPGVNFACALQTNFNVMCWGDGSMGQLGLGKPVAMAAPTQVPAGDGVSWYSIGAGYSAMYGNQVVPPEATMP
ncbi:hypothetical protein H632_c105p0 [Helicosporidium sp. ATCC 50920]|nr:hypothetical protein H632_c105p0 [Helicosporidium sp. ATCC 50920]|eukprot:KDD76786.1 hypothetical protein H632_c105p0 [Helicosporidium sp. ATCC 50920]